MRTPVRPSSFPHLGCSNLVCEICLLAEHMLWWGTTLAMKGKLKGLGHLFVFERRKRWPSSYQCRRDTIYVTARYLSRLVYGNIDSRLRNIIFYIGIYVGVSRLLLIMRECEIYLCSVWFVCYTGKDDTNSEARMKGVSVWTMGVLATVPTPGR